MKSRPHIRAIVRSSTGLHYAMHWTLKSAKLWLKEMWESEPTIKEYAVYDDRKRIPIAMSVEYRDRYGDKWLPV